MIHLFICCNLQSYILLLFDVDILQEMAYARKHCELSFEKRDKD